MAILKSDMPNQIPEDQEQRRALGVAMAAKKVLRYFHADEITGVRVSAKTQQRLVHRHTFLLPNPDEAIEEICVDGGKVRLRTAQGEACEWRDYKAIATAQGRIANFQNNAQLIEWVNAQPLANPVTCLGDGHDGVWNTVQHIAMTQQRQEIFDWLQCFG